MMAKAEAYGNYSDWLKNRRGLIEPKELIQLGWTRDTVATGKLVEIELQNDLCKRSGRSPDVAEALMLTFTVKAATPRIR